METEDRIVECQHCGQKYRNLPNWVTYADCPMCWRPIRPATKRSPWLTWFVLPALVVAAFTLPLPARMIVMLTVYAFLVPYGIACKIIVYRAMVRDPDEADQSSALRKYIWSGVLLAVILGVVGYLVVAYGVR
jgi:hypothetical protein